MQREPGDTPRHCSIVAHRRTSRADRAEWGTNSSSFGDPHREPRYVDGHTAPPCAPETGSVRTPALNAWCRELAAGRRRATTFDPLWEAACAEMNAREAAGAGQADAAARDFR